MTLFVNEETPGSERVNMAVYCIKIITLILFFQ